MKHKTVCHSERIEPHALSEANGEESSRTFVIEKRMGNPTGFLAALSATEKDGARLV
jgi:hypothetical protein